ncbi:MAG TPA: hypothetical protein VGQ67_03200 [Candidatus Polarisedimenticolia bacterium]|jgi:hypothetical protein|nr:hypothetical protein [Candidatus Polarisedimenticolia bacterium]
MNSIRILALALIVGGLFGLVYGGFTYTKERHDLRLGNLDLSIKDNRTFNIPAWAGAGAIAAGAGLLIVRPKLL